MSWVALGSAAISAGGSYLSSRNQGGGGGNGLQDARTDQQRQAANLLFQLGSTGSGGGINLGELFGGSFGEFNQTQGEIDSLQRLTGLLGGQDITKARETFANLADTKFDPSDPKSGFAEFSRALARSGKESSDVLNREAAISGSRFGTGIQKSKVDLSERLQDIRGQKLSDLFQRSRQQQLAGAQGLHSLVGTQAGLEGQITRQAAVERQLKDLKAQRQYQDFTRARGETLGRIGILQGEANRNPYLGVDSLPSQSPFSGLASSLLGSFGQSVGSGGFDFSSLFSMFGGGGNVPGTGQSQSQILGFDTSQFS